MPKKQDRKALLARRLMVQRLLLATLAFGLCIMFYPFVQRLYFDYRSVVAAEQYTQAVDEQPREALEAAWNDAQAYNQAHRMNDVFDPFGEEPAATAERAEYARLINPMGDGVMGYVDIPKIGQRLNVYHGTDDQALLKGVGHLQGTSLPVGGMGTHCVLSGHRGLPAAKIFTDLDQLKAGDLILLHVLGHVLAYEVDGTSVVLPTEVGALAIEPDEDVLTLVTCTPYAVNTHRLLVHGHAVPVPDDLSAEEGLSLWVRVRLALIVLGSLIAFVTGAVMVVRTFVRRPGIQEGRRMKSSSQNSGSQEEQEAPRGRHMASSTKKGSGHGK